LGRLNGGISLGGYDIDGTPTNCRWIFDKRRFDINKES